MAVVKGHPLIDTPIVGMILFIKDILSDILCVEFSDFGLCSLLCREGLWSSAVYLGDFSRFRNTSDVSGIHVWAARPS